MIKKMAANKNKEKRKNTIKEKHEKIKKRNKKKGNENFCIARRSLEREERREIKECKKEENVPFSFLSHGR